MATQEQQGLQAEMTAAGMTPASDAFGTGISTYQAYSAEDGMKFNAIEDFVGEEGVCPHPQLVEKSSPTSATLST